MRMMVAAITSEKSQEIGAEHIESCDAGCNCSNPEHPGSMRVSCGKNRVLTEEAGESGDSGYRQACNAQRHKCDRHRLTQAAHMTQILLPAKSMNNAAGAQK